MNLTLENETACDCQGEWIVLENAINGIIVPVFAILGLGGNIVVILAYRHCNMKNSTFLMLLGTLAVVDFLCLLMLIIDVALMQAWIADIHSAFYNYLQFYMLNAFKSIIFTYETYLIIAISMERYLAACWPILYRQMELKSRHFLPRVLLYAFPALILSILINIPKLFELKLIDFVFVDEETNETHHFVEVIPTALRQNPAYITFYRHWTRVIFDFILPFSSLLFLNSYIYYSMRRQKTNNTRRENNSAIVLVLIVFLFLLFSVPKVVINIADIFFHHSNKGLSNCGCLLSPAWYSFFLCLNNFCLVANSSCNVIIYWLVCPLFKAAISNVLPSCTLPRLHQSCWKLIRNILNC